MSDAEGARASGPSDSEVERALAELERAIDVVLGLVRARARTDLAHGARTEPPLLLDEGAPGAAADLFRSLGGEQVSASHPRYFGFPKGTVSRAAIVGSTLAAAQNPELASRHHAPWAIAIEDRICAAFAERFGMPEGRGHFTGGASEGLLTAVSLAREPGQPLTIFASVDAHPSLFKVARTAGVTPPSIVLVPVDGAGAMSPTDLARLLGERRSGRKLIVSTFGTTTTGALDPVRAIAELAARAEATHHVDAAYGGLLAFGADRAAALDLGLADSIAVDPSKFLDVPSGIGVFVARDGRALERAFAVSARYVPKGRDEPLRSSLMWSRPSRGFAVYAALRARGWSGLAEVIDRRSLLAKRLREGLEDQGFLVRPGSLLPVVTFGLRAPKGRPARELVALSKHVSVAIGAYVPVVRLVSGEPVLRAAIVSELTNEGDVDALIAALADGRRARSSDSEPQSEPHSGRPSESDPPQAR